MKDDQLGPFKPRASQSFDIPTRVRVSLYVAAPAIGFKFETAFYDNKLLKAIAEGPFDRYVRSRLMSAKLAGRMAFETVKAAEARQPIENFLDFLQVEESARETLLSAHRMVEITAVENLSEELPALRLVHFAAGFLARELSGVAIEPYALKVMTGDDEGLALDLATGSGTPSLKCLLSVVQSKQRGDSLLSTTHGLSRFGLPEFVLRAGEPDLAEPIARLLRGTAQEFLETFLRTRQAGLDRYALDQALTICPETLAKSCGETAAPRKRKASVTIPLLLKRTAAGPTLTFNWHGRREEKNALLRKALQDLGLIGAGPGAKRQ